MKDIKITKDSYLPKEKVQMYVSYSSHSIQVDVRNKKKDGKVYDLTCGKKIASVIYLTTGELVLVNTALDTLYARMNDDSKGVV